MYDPTIGRWMEQDPLGLIPGPNPYEYVNNRPTVETDPSGMDSVEIRQDGAVIWIKGTPGKDGQPLRPVQYVMIGRSAGNSPKYESPYVRLNGVSTSLLLSSVNERATEFQRFLGSSTYDKFWNDLKEPVRTQMIIRFLSDQTAYRLADKIEDTVLSYRIVPVNQQAEQIMRNVRFLLSDDDAWAKTLRFYRDNPPTYVSRLLQGNRGYYQALVNKVVNGFLTKPPEFAPGSASGGEGSGLAYVSPYNRSVIRIRPFFWTSTQNPPAQQPYTIIHEYARFYLWDEVPDENNNEMVKGDIANWDTVMQRLGKDYDRIIHLSG
jgi:hypothetical protein